MRLDLEQFCHARSNDNFDLKEYTTRVFKQTFSCANTNDPSLALLKWIEDNFFGFSLKNLPQRSSNKLDLVRTQMVLHRLSQDGSNNNFFGFSLENSPQWILILDFA